MKISNLSIKSFLHYKTGSEPERGSKTAGGASEGGLSGLRRLPDGRSTFRGGFPRRIPHIRTRDW